MKTFFPGRFKSLAPWFASVVLLASVAMNGWAAVPREPALGLDPSQGALVRATCRDVMGLLPGQAQFNACADALADTLRRRAVDVSVAKAYEVCNARSNSEDKAETAGCVLNLEEEAPSATVGTDAPKLSFVATKAPPFASMSRAVRLDHERLSCAQLGINPVEPAFNYCVVSLVQTFFGFDNPL